jgi:hypothetical protein
MRALSGDPAVVVAPVIVAPTPFVDATVVPDTAVVNPAAKSPFTGVINRSVTSGAALATETAGRPTTDAVIVSPVNSEELWPLLPIAVIWKIADEVVAAVAPTTVAEV